MSRREPVDPPLPPAARALLAAYRGDRRMPRAAFARVERRLEHPAAHGMRVAVIAVAAAAVTIAALMGLQSITTPRTDAAVEHDLASDVRDAPPTPARATEAERGHATTVGDPDERTPPVAEPPSSAATLTPGASRPTGAAASTPAQRQRARPDTPDDDDARTPATGGDATEVASTLAIERTLLGRAQRALTAGELAAARSIADEHRRRFPGGVLRPELDAIDTVARCRGGVGEGPALASAFAATHPGSPLRATVDEACARR